MIICICEIKKLDRRGGPPTDQLESPGISRGHKLARGHLMARRPPRGVVRPRQTGRPLLECLRAETAPAPVVGAEKGSVGQKPLL
jgi:hypothetical protein